MARPAIDQAAKQALSCEEPQRIERNEARWEDGSDSG